MTYTFSDETVKSEETAPFAIDRFSGKIILKNRLDYESKDEYQLKIAASDSAHIAQTILTIRVNDVNDNAPIFHQPAYHVTLPGKWENLFYVLFLNFIIPTIITKLYLYFGHVFINDES